MQISIVIPTLNEENYIGKLLESLYTQSHQPHEIIVVDGNSDDETRKIAKKYKNVRVFKTIRKVGHQRTYGGKRAKGDLLIFMDADVIPHKDYLKRVHNHFIYHKHDLACPMYVPYQSTVSINTIYYIFSGIFFLTQKFLPSGGGMCIAVKKSVFNATGGFRSDFTYDDIEFIRRASKGHQFGVIPTRLHVSDRRFKKDGVWKTLSLYILLSLFFIFGQFKLANKIKYSFGSYS
jgi:glycosyltransferase involved in cell wall biosynthesis